MNMGLEEITEVKWYKLTTTEGNCQNISYTPIYKNGASFSDKTHNYDGILRMHPGTVLPSAQELALFCSNAAVEQVEHEYDEWTRTFCVYFKDNNQWHAAFDDLLYYRLKHNPTSKCRPLYAGPIRYNSQNGFFLKRIMKKPNCKNVVNQIRKVSQLNGLTIAIPESNQRYYETDKLESLLGDIQLKFKTRHPLENVVPKLRLDSQEYLNSLNLPEYACPVKAIALVNTDMLRRSFHAWKNTFDATKSLNCHLNWRYVQKNTNASYASSSFEQC